MLSIANYNMHCGMDGWGRPYDYVGAIRALDADVIMLEEAWTSEGDGGGGQAAEAARALGYQVAAHTMGRGRRIRPQPDAPEAWRARAMWADENKALYMDGVRPLPERVRAMARWQEAEPGTLGIAVLVRPDLPMEATRLVHMSVLRADRVLRAALVVDLTVDGVPMSVAGTHMAHLPFGSHRNWAELRRQLQTDARPDAVLAGRHEHLGPAGPPVHAGLAPGRDRRDLAHLAPAQPDRPHPRARRRAPGLGRGAPPRRLGPPARAGRAGDPTAGTATDP